MWKAFIKDQIKITLSLEKRHIFTSDEGDTYIKKTKWEWPIRLKVSVNYCTEVTSN